MTVETGIAPREPKSPWIQAEYDLLDDRYEEIGPKGIQKLLPWRSYRVICVKAFHRGLKMRRTKGEERRLASIERFRLPDIEPIALSFNGVSPHFWRTLEIGAVDRYYPIWGSAGVRRALPHRSRDSIYHIASKRGLKTTAPRGPSVLAV